MRSRLLSLVFVAGSVLLQTPAHAATIVSVIGDPGGPVVLDSSSDGAGQITEASWTQTTAFSNFSIQAALFGAAGTHVQAYLTDAIGLGTTAANVIASGSFLINSEPSGQFPPVWTDLFTGTNLGAGTYYLVLGFTDTVFGIGFTDFTGWYSANDATASFGQPITMTTWPGVTYNGSLAVFNTNCCGTIDSTFLPDSTGWRGWGYDPIFRVCF